MADQDRGYAAALKDVVVRDGRRFSFVQIVRLLRLILSLEAENGADKFSQRKAIRVRPALNLSFPGTDIVSVKESQAEGPFRFLVTATFLGLYGSCSPLPTFYTEDLLAEAAEDMSVGRDFLDIINAPLYPLHFQCWSKYRLGIKVLEEGDPRGRERLFCLLGLGHEKIRQQIDGAYDLIRYIGLFTQRPRSALGLETLLSDALEMQRLKVVPCIQQKRAIPEDQRCRLGVCGNQMGEDIYLGRRIKDRMGKFRVSIGPLPGKAFNDLLPDAAWFRKLCNLIRAYLDQPLEWDLEVIIPRKEVRTTCLGGSTWSRLGWNTWIFSKAHHAQLVKTRLRAPLQRMI